MKQKHTDFIWSDEQKAMVERMRKRHENDGTIDSLKMWKFEIGDLAVGIRVGSSGHLMIGILIDGYVTINEGYRNPAYVLNCVDGKIRSFQGIRKINQSQVERIVIERENYLRGGKI